jgi:predicted DNA repair protein MutK
MATSLLALLDDIATLLDDVAVLSKVAARKTAGVLGDDLALNAQQVAGLRAHRELPVVWAVFKGSLLNKAVLVPAALAVSAIAPWAVMPLLMLGGAYLCYEGFEKVAHRFFSGRTDDAHADAHVVDPAEALADAAVDLAAVEKARIKGAVRTDFILSAEIIVITLGIVATAPFRTRVAVLAAIALLMTVGVYGLVAGIIKIDDAGLYLSRREGAGALVSIQRGLGRSLLRAAPWLMKTLSVLGTIAMFLVGGGILAHGIPAVHHLIEDAAARVAALPGVGGAAGPVTALLLDIVLGILVGGAVLAIVSAARRLRPRTAGS